MDQTPTAVPRTSPLLLALAFTVLCLEGYDLVMYGTVVPSLLAYEPWGLDPKEVGFLGSAAVFGMGAGALLAAWMGDRWGRRRTIICSVVLFSVAMGVCALATSPEMFGIGRFVVGLGAGALMPTAMAILLEFSPPDRRARSAAIGFVGVGFGGMASGLLSLWLVPSFGFRGMFVAGSLPVLVVVPILIKKLPESPAFLRARGLHAEAAAIEHRFRVEPVSGPSDGAQATESKTTALFGRSTWRATVLFWAATFCSLMVFFGVSSWLPQLMRSAGYPLTSALSFVLVLNAGAVIGSLGASVLADRFGLKSMSMVAMAAAALSLAALSLAPPTIVVYLLVALAGFGTQGSQILLNAYVGSYYPAFCRTTGLGLALAIGRVGGVLGPIYGGVYIASGAPLNLQFLAFALPAVVGVAAVALVPRAVTTRQVRQTPAAVDSSVGGAAVDADDVAFHNPTLKRTN